MFITNTFSVGDAIKDFVAAVWDGSIDDNAAPSFEYIVQNQGTTAIRLGSAFDTGLNASNGYLLGPSDEFRVVLPSPNRLGAISAIVGTTATAINVTMVEH